MDEAVPGEVVRTVAGDATTAQARAMALVLGKPVTAFLHDTEADSLQLVEPGRAQVE